MALERQVQLNRQILGLIHAKHAGDPAWGTANTLEWRYAQLLAQDAQIGEAYLRDTQANKEEDGRKESP